MLNVYDFFSGCGGASKGFEQAGCTIKLGIDIDRDAANTFRTNFPQAASINKDIRKITYEEIDAFINRDEPMLFCGCAPCQPFSKQNQQKKEDDSRINLLGEFTRFVKHYKPNYIFVENVPGIQNINPEGEGPLRTFTDALSFIGYHYCIKIITSADYGVPQPRKRLIIIASRECEIAFPKETNGKTTGIPYSTVEDWIADLPELEAGKTDAQDKNHTATSLSPLNMQRIVNTPEGGGRSDWPEELRLKCHKGHSGHTDVYGRLAFNKLACTLTTRCISYSNGRYGHPTQNRAISIREAACLQTFPRDFDFCGSLNAKARQIGNAVPPLVAYNFGKLFSELERG